MEGDMNKKGKISVRIPLVVKLISIISAILVLSLGIVLALTLVLFSRDTSSQTEANNFMLVELAAERMESEFRTVHAASLSLLDTIQTANNTLLKKSLRQKFFDRNTGIIYVGIVGGSDFFNDTFFSEKGLSKKNVVDFLQENSTISQQYDKEFVINASPWFGMACAAIVSPYIEKGKKTSLIVILATESLQEMVQSGSAFLTYAVSQQGDVLVYPDSDAVIANVLPVNSDLIDKIQSSGSAAMQFQHKSKNTNLIVAFRQIAFGDFFVVSSIPTNLVYQTVIQTAFQNILLSVVILLLSILAIWFFSQSISRPIKTLAIATKQIEAGDFLIDLAPKTHDEIGVLTESFVHMGKGLAERERLRETFGKFVNKEIAEQAAKGELQLGGERKKATVFFSDIRSFTAISEKMSPEGVVEFLNAYMTEMVDCINQTHGSVDKFIGDAIMGLWGVPVTAGSIVQDAENAVRGMLLMRHRLIRFNQDRGTPEKPVLHIGCGANTGELLAGQIGSSERMEYTVIGDAVNTASRIEALNKPFGTDILISETTYNLLKDKLIVEAMPAITVKGKEEPLQIFAVVNFKGAKGPQTLAEVRSLVGIKTPSTIKDPNKKEVKYEILQKK